MSKNGVGLFVLALSLLGVEVSEDAVMQVVTAGTTIISFALMVWNQVQRKDVTLFFWKRDKVER
jgi:hypothetical protein